MELHAWRHAESGTFAMFVYEKIGERLLRHITGTNENEAIRQTMEWIQDASETAQPKILCNWVEASLIGRKSSPKSET